MKKSSTYPSLSVGESSWDNNCKKKKVKRPAIVIVAVFPSRGRADRLGSRADLFAESPPPPPTVWYVRVYNARERAANLRATNWWIAAFCETRTTANFALFHVSAKRVYRIHILAPAHAHAAKYDHDDRDSLFPLLVCYYLGSCSVSICFRVIQCTYSETKIVWSIYLFDVVPRLNVMREIHTQHIKTNITIK